MKTKNILLIFGQEVMYKPIIYRLVKDFNIIFNVLEAKIYPKQEGRIILELKGEDKDLNQSIKYLKKEGVNLKVLSEIIKKDEKKCVHCGACTTVCRLGALAIERSTMKVIFDSKKCIACGLCRTACPLKAMSGVTIDEKKESTRKHGIT
jgi:ferredoxin